MNVSQDYNRVQVHNPYKALEVNMIIIFTYLPLTLYTFKVKSFLALQLAS